MSLKNSLSLSPALYALFLGIAPVAYGQSILETASEQLNQLDPAAQFEAEVAAGQVDPSLFDEEFDDIGPQYLLVPGVPPHDWFLGLLDIQWYNSSNPTLAEKSDRKSADLFVLTAQFGVVTPKKDIWGGQLDLQGGLRYQIFDYGTISGDVLINNRRITQSNFQANTLFSDLKWQRDQWKAQFGLRWTTLNNRSNGTNYYNEWVPNWSGGYHKFCVN